ncbi:MAG: hypothetical protein HC896_10210 [Bacteroidales bacterium]|nr:hypothetical protein [Bacteroidales bacterium]
MATSGDQASGNIDIVSKRIAKSNSIELSTGINYNLISENVFGDFTATQNINDATMGFYKRPYNIRESLTKQSWNTEERKLPVDYGASLVGGENFSFSNNHKLYVFGTLSHSGSSEYRKGTYEKYRSNSLDASFH